MGQNKIHCLPTLIKRLEAVVSRLEDIAASASVEIPPTALLFSEYEDPQSASVSTEVLESHNPPPQVASSNVPDAVVSFDTFLRDTVGNFQDVSQQVGSVVADQAAALQRGFTALRGVLLAATRAKKPDLNVGVENAAYQRLLRPIEEALTACQAIQQDNRGSSAFDMLSAVADGSFVLTWVTVEAKPGKRVEDAFAMAQYFGNKVLKNAIRESLQFIWVEAFYALFRELQVFVSQEYPYGIVWNGSGQDLSVVADTKE